MILTSFGRKGSGLTSHPEQVEKSSAPNRVKLAFSLSMDKLLGGSITLNRAGWLDTLDAHKANFSNYETDIVTTMTI